ncbi:MAG: hypothetical protein IPP28_07820 [Xanthomonadales bacterium]|nr:hypothetical protein [Xanthomonadales bacterium]MBP7624908.1 hypothetical protein [Xanthomonadales bacterium]
MIRKSQLFLAVAALVGMNAAMAACNTTQWGQGSVTAVVGTPTPGNPTAADADGIVRRYNGVCGLRATAPANYVQDGLPSAEPSFIARFYVYTGVTGGTAKVFNALNTAAAGSTFSVDWNGTGFDFKTGAGATAFTIAATGTAPFNNKWYAVELKYTDATDTVSAKVKGNGALTENVGSAAGFTVAGPDTVQFGFVSGTATGEIHVDAYESRRSTDIGRLLRGDASGNGLRDSGDLLPLRTESIGSALSPGNPNCNEDAPIDGGDLSCLRVLLVNGGE